MNDKEICLILQKHLHVLRLCLKECESGSMWSRNPYLRSSSTKKKLQALHESIECVIQDVLLFCAQASKVKKMQGMLQGYSATIAFLFAFNDGIAKEEYDHRILIRDSLLQAKFNKLFAQSEYLLTSYLRIQKLCESVENS